jgi:hypothetical protein
MLTLEQFIADKITLTDIEQFRTFFEGIGAPGSFSQNNPPSKIYVYQGWNFIYKERSGQCVLEIANMVYTGKLEELELILLKWYNSECDEQPLKMKTSLPSGIKTADEARQFLRALFNNGEDFDLYDNPAFVLKDGGPQHLFNPGEAAVIRSLINDMLSLPAFDAHCYLLQLHGHIIEE